MLTPLDATTEGTDTNTVLNGGPPGFNNIAVEANGARHGVVVDMGAQVTLPGNTNDWSDMVVTYQLNMAEGESTRVYACDKQVGTPPVANVMVVSGASIAAQDKLPDDECCPDTRCNQHGTFGIQPGASVFHGSANGDSRLDLADAVYLLNWLFRGGPDLPCQLAGDANGDCALDESDAIFIINYLFLDGDAPPLGTDCVIIELDACAGLTCDVPTECSQ